MSTFWLPMACSGRTAGSSDFGLATRRVTDPQDIAPALREAFASGKPNFVDMRVADGFGA